MLLDLVNNWLLFLDLLLLWFVNLRVDILVLVQEMDLSLVNVTILLFVLISEGGTALERLLLELFGGVIVLFD